MSDLAGFLLKRILDEEESAMRAAGWGPSGRERAAGWWRRQGVNTVVDDDGRVVIRGDGGPPGDEQADHVVTWSPARVLAECEAKRRIVEDLRDELANQHDPEPTTLQLAERLLLTLALPYADHPDYLKEWRA